MKRLMTLALCAVALCGISSALPAEELPDWKNPHVVQRNRLPMATTFEAGGLNLSLNGMWKFN